MFHTNIRGNIKGQNIFSLWSRYGLDYINMGIWPWYFDKSRSLTSVLGVWKFQWHKHILGIRQNPVSGWILIMGSLNWILATYLECTAQMQDLAEIQWRNLLNQDSPTHWVLFLSCTVFVEYISIKLFIFIWNSMNYSNVVSSLISTSTIFHMTAPFIKLPDNSVLNLKWYLCDIIYNNFRNDKT